VPGDGYTRDIIIQGTVDGGPVVTARYGGGADFAHLKKLAQGRGRNFDPHWDETQLLNFLRAANCFVLPNINPANHGTGPFPLQGSGTGFNQIGNDTRYNPKLRLFPNLNENISVARTFPIRESLRLEFRAESFNPFNRVRFGTGSNQLQNQQFGVLTGSGSQINSPRNIQLAMKLYF